MFSLVHLTARGQYAAGDEMSLLVTRPVTRINLDDYASKEGLRIFVENLYPKRTPGQSRPIWGRVWRIFVTQPDYLDLYEPGLRFGVRCGECHGTPESCDHTSSRSIVGIYSGSRQLRYTLVDKRSVIKAMRILKRLRDRNLDPRAPGYRLRSMTPEHYDVLAAWVAAGFPEPDRSPDDRKAIPMPGR